MAVSFGANLLGVRKPVFYAAVGVVIWIAILKSGVHATVAGVLLAFTVPAQTYLDRDLFLRRSRRLLDDFEGTAPNSPEAHAAVHALETQCELIESPLQRIERYIHPWVSFLVMPLFGLANAGVRILGNLQPALKHPVSLGVVLGLFVGKPLRVYLFAWLSARSRMAELPPSLSWREVFGASWLCGIGFTMSLFIGALSFGEGLSMDMARIGILTASLAAGVCGSMVLGAVRRAKFCSAVNP